MDEAKERSYQWLAKQMYLNTHNTPSHYPWVTFDSLYVPVVYTYAPIANKTDI